MSDKTCKNCEETKDSDEFRRRSNLCKTCEKDPKSTRKCLRCKEIYILIRFDGDGNICYFCRKGRWRVCVSCQENKTTEQYRKGQPQCNECASANIAYNKKCKSCDKTTPSTNFRPNRKICLDCERSYGRTYRRTTDKAKTWVDNNKNRMSELTHDWYEKNKPKIREKEKTRIAEDPMFKTVKYYRNKVSRCVRGILNWSEDLKSSSEDFRSWLSSLCDEDMNFDNYASVWNVDHVLPLDLLCESPNNEWCRSLLQEQRATPEELLFSWYNTQPLRKESNRLKGREITLESLKTHLITLDKFMKKNSRIKTRTYKAYRKVLFDAIDTFYE